MCVYSAPAYAQIEEIIVEARKVEENLQDVPISVTALPGAALKNAGITEFPQIAQVTPNFDVRSDEVRGSFASVINIRGQNSTTSDLTIDQAVGININGAPITRGTNLFGNLFDIEQVEILRGPQGTLFGKNTTGGTVNVTTTAPQLGEFSGYGEVTVGNFDRNDYEAVFNVPLGENAAFRFGANEKKKTENSPDYFVKSGRCDLGVAWNDVTEPEDDTEPLEYISVKLDAPEMDKPINAALFHRDDGADLVWSRPKKVI